MYKCKITKVIEYNIGDNLSGLGFVNDFLGIDMTLKEKSMKEKTDELDFIKIKNFL